MGPHAIFQSETLRLHFERLTVKADSEYTFAYADWSCWECLHKWGLNFAMIKSMIQQLACAGANAKFPIIIYNAPQKRLRKQALMGLSAQVNPM